LARRTALLAHAIDLEGDGDDQVIAGREPNVKGAFDSDACRVDEVGVVLAARHQHQRVRTSAASRAPSWAHRARGACVAPQARLLDRLRNRLQQGVVCVRARLLASPTIEIELFLNLVSAGVCHLVAEIAQLSEISTEGPLGHTRLLGQLERVQSRLGDDRSENPEQPGEPLSPIHHSPLGKLLATARRPTNPLGTAGMNPAYAPSWLANFFP